MITHGAPGDTFWDLVRKGAEDAAKKDNLELRYSNDPQAPNQANLVQSAIDSQVDGIALTMPNADALGPVAKRAADSGIPTVALNAGMDEYCDYDVTAFFGPANKPANASPKKTPDTYCASFTNKATRRKNPAAPASKKASAAANSTSSTSTAKTSPPPRQPCRPNSPKTPASTGSWDSKPPLPCEPSTP